MDTSESLLPGDVFMARSKTFLFRASEADASAKVNDVDSGNVGSMATVRLIMPNTWLGVDLQTGVCMITSVWIAN